MATSDETPGDIRAFLASPPNLIGLLAAVVIFVAVALASEAPLAALLAALLGYGAGYVLTPPRDRKTYASGIPVQGATAEEMSWQLSEFRSRLRAHRRSLPPSADQELAVIVRHLAEVLDRWEDVKRAPEQRMALESIVYQYLPTTLDVFLRLPDSEKPAAAPEWTDQLRLLGNEVAGARRVILQHDLEAMRTNGRLLEQKFEDGDLKMFREHGL